LLSQGIIMAMDIITRITTNTMTDITPAIPPAMALPGSNAIKVGIITVDTTRGLLSQGIIMATDIITGIITNTTMDITRVILLVMAQPGSNAIRVEIITVDITRGLLNQGIMGITSLDMTMDGRSLTRVITRGIATISMEIIMDNTVITDIMVTMDIMGTMDTTVTMGTIVTMDTTVIMDTMDTTVIMNTMDTTVIMDTMEDTTN
ncbi:Hypothetical protein FKW44_007062, partial [Caligus rogercresseyi]